MSDWLIVGLGNPGEQYTWSRHNLGFMLIDKLAGDSQITVLKPDCKALAGGGVIGGTRVKLLKPQTFMNRSGEAVSCMLRRSNSEDPLQALIVISDDLALPLGKIRIRQRGSAGGHNGLKSIISELGTEEFPRLRIGIQPEHPISDARRFVLDTFSKSERGLVEDTLELAATAVRSVLTEGILTAMTRFN